MKSGQANESHKIRLLRKHPVLCLILFCTAVILWWPTVYTNLVTRSERFELSRYSMQKLPKRLRHCARRGFKNSGTEPSPYLQWRIETAVKLYQAGKVHRLLMTGDGSYADHDEPNIMKKVALELGVPENDIEVDKFGFDTYDSCVRAHDRREVKAPSW
ncbi:YdcF family protein [Candidatus Saccharibacteria bacterium]|nr:MAG: YdcF family protein [Candidatus Saccharibacteria bacterium]